jgi:hypothetical protein
MSDTAVKYSSYVELANFSRFTGLAICVMSIVAFVALDIRPLWGDYFFNCGEVEHALQLADTARQAISNGEFPLQYANDSAVTLRPIFLYYTPIYYGVAGLIQLATGLDPNRTMLILIVIMACSATLGTYAVTRMLGGSQIASGVAAATLPFSPYFLTDTFARGALAELSAWAMFPWMVYAFLGFCARPRLRSAIAFILTTSLLILSHKIFFPWVAIFLALLGATMLGPRRVLAVSPFLVLCGIAAMALTAPYWLNAMLLGDSLNIVRATHDAPFWPLTANLWVFWPLPYSDPSLAGYPNFNLQVGPLVGLTLIVSIFYLKSHQIRALWIVTIATCLLVCSFFDAFKFWEYLPKTLLSIQFPYRFLMLSTTLGTIAAGLVLTSVVRDGNHYLIAAFAVAIATTFSFWWSPGVSESRLDTTKNIEFANGGDMYFENGGPKVSLPLPPTILRSTVKAKGNTVTGIVDMHEGGPVVLPVQYSSRLTALVNGSPAEVSNANGLVSISLPAQKASIEIRRDEPVGFVPGILLAIFLIPTIGLALRRGATF